MAALCNRAGHYIFALWFLLYSIFFISLPNLSRRRLDVYHTSTHGVALVRILDAGLKRARASLKVQDAKKSPKIRHLGTVEQICRAISSQLRHVSTIGKRLVRQQYLPHISSQYGELRPTSGWGRFGCLGHPSKFQQVSRLGFVTARHSSRGRQPNCGVEQRAPAIFGRAAITLGNGPHSSLYYKLMKVKLAGIFRI